MHNYQSFNVLLSFYLKNRLSLDVKISSNPCALNVFFLLINRSKGIDGLRDHYSKNYEHLKIDRIIFIASATSPLPNRLMEAVRNIARKEDRGKLKRIPILWNQSDPQGQCSLIFKILLVRRNEILWENGLLHYISNQLITLLNV